MRVRARLRGRRPGDGDPDVEGFTRSAEGRARDLHIGGEEGLVRVRVSHSRHDGRPL